MLGDINGDSKKIIVDKRSELLANIDEEKEVNIQNQGKNYKGMEWGAYRSLHCMEKLK